MKHRFTKNRIFYNYAKLIVQVGLFIAIPACFYLIASYNQRLANNSVKIGSYALSNQSGKKQMQPVLNGQGIKGMDSTASVLGASTSSNPIANTNQLILNKSITNTDLQVQTLNYQINKLIGDMTKMQSRLQILDKDGAGSYWDYTNSAISTGYPLSINSIYATDGIYANLTTNMLDAGMGLLKVGTDGTISLKGQLYIDSLIYGHEGNLLFADTINAPKVVTNAYAVQNIDGYNTAGSSVLFAGSLHQVVITKAVNTGSKIFITPRTNTFGEVVYVGEVKEGESFTMRINKPLNEDIIIDWWIVTVELAEQ